MWPLPPGRGWEFWMWETVWTGGTWDGVVGAEGEGLGASPRPPCVWPGCPVAGERWVLWGIFADLGFWNGVCRCQVESQNGLCSMRHQQEEKPRASVHLGKGCGLKEIDAGLGWLCSNGGGLAMREEGL